MYKCFLSVFVLPFIFCPLYSFQLESLALANLTSNAFELAHIRLAHCLANELDAALNSCLIKILYLTLTGDLLI